MEWLNWLDKKIDISELKEDTPEQKKLAKEIADDDNEDHKQQFTPTLEPKEASWESWLDDVNLVNKRSKFKDPPSSFLPSGKKPDAFMHSIAMMSIADPTERAAAEDKHQKQYYPEEWKDSQSKKKSWELFLDKNNAIETDHKKENKEEWDGKFSSSTTRDDVKDDENDDDKAVSEEESLEELTDGELVEIEKLKSWETWLEKDALTNAWIETIPKKPRNNSMIDSQSYSRQSTGTRYEQDPTGKRSASSSKWSKLGDLGEIKYDRILNNEGEKTDKHVKNHNAGGSKRNALAHGNKKRQQNAATKKPTPPTGKAPTGVGKAWEAWLEKNEKWDKQEKDNDKKSKINRTGKIGKKDAKDIVRRTYDGQTPNKFMQQVNSNMAADEEKQSGSKHRGDKRVPLTRVRTHTNQPLRLGGVAEDTPIGASHQSDHQLRTGRKEQYIEPKNADLWKTWLDKVVEHKDGTEGVIGAMTKIPIKRAETAEDIRESAKDPKTKITLTPDMKKKKSWEEWVEKQQGAGDARFGNQHLTGLDQKPVNNEEDEANIMPEKDEKTDDKEEKPNEKEENYEEGNKPYKALDVK